MMEMVGKVWLWMAGLYSWLQRGWRVDERGLAVGRALVAAVLVGDLLNRARWMTAHYTDAGVLPRETMFLYFFHEQWFSLHAISGAWGMEVVLFCIHGAFSVAMLVGYRTSTVTMAAWLLTCSLQSRNLLVSHGGDVLLRMLLFFFMFLPIANRYSVDAVMVKYEKLRNSQRGETEIGDHCNGEGEKRGRRRARAVADLRTLALILQMCMMYFWNFLHKNGDTWRVEANAPFYALQLDYFRTWVGDIALALTPLWLYPFLTWTVLLIEMAGWLLLLSPIHAERARLVAALTLLVMHVSFLSCLSIGMFGFIAVSGCVTLLPSLFWDTLRDFCGLAIVLGPRRGLRLSLSSRREETDELLRRKSVTLFYDHSYASSCLLACIADVFVDSRLVSVRPSSCYRPTPTESEENSDAFGRSSEGEQEKNKGLLLRSVQEDITVLPSSRGGGMGLGGFLVTTGGEDCEHPGKHGMKMLLDRCPLARVLAPSHEWRLRIARATVRHMEGKNRSEAREERETSMQRERIAEEHARMSREALADVWREYAKSNAVLAVIQEAAEHIGEQWDWKEAHKLLWGVFVISCIVWANLWCLAQYSDHSFFPPAYATGVWLRLDQQWTMFAPDPPQASYYYLIPGHLRNGTVVELFRNRGLFEWKGTALSNRDRGTASEYRANVGSHRWAKFFENLNNHEHEDLLRERFLHYVCEQWNERHTDTFELVTVALEYYLVRQNADGTRKPPKRVPLATVRCDGTSLGVAL